MLEIHLFNLIGYLYLIKSRNEKNMNILFISPNSPYDSVGGIERYMSNLLQFSKNNRSNKTTIVLPTAGNNCSKEIGSVKIFFDNNINVGNTSKSQQEISNKALNFSKTIENIISKRQIQIICAENFHLGLPPAYALLINMVAGLSGVPLVLRLHSFAKTDLQTELINQLMWKKVSCVSKSVAGDCFHKGADIERITTDYLGINTETFNNSLDAKSFKKIVGFLKAIKLY
jgi:glycosyltransferase involved in cell wall biosynthesis